MKKIEFEQFKKMYSILIELLHSDCDQQVVFLLDKNKVSLPMIRSVIQQHPLTNQSLHDEQVQMCVCGTKGEYSINNICQYCGGYNPLVKGL